MLKAFLFDMDGVLYDSMRGHVQAWHDTLAAEGIVVPPAELYLYEGRTGHSTINLLFNRTFGRNATPEEVERIYLHKAQRFNELESPESKPMPGAWEVLQQVKQAGLQRIIVTGSGQQSLFEKLDKHFPAMFDRDKMVTAYDVKHGKPNPEPYLKGLQKGGLQPDEAIVVENAPLGVEAARAAGVFTVAVNTGPLADDILWNAGANFVYPSMQALADDFDAVIAASI
ncbi:MAG: HAD-IA family hydrolase [Candidatus Symbiothrix sp.]|jgi:HAD superfamily hydrolase (TIGR01509 family)|nr:HAD-IA family hydrolase [Candidatus Symbiothrix sp.]